MGAWSNLVKSLKLGSTPLMPHSTSTDELVKSERVQEAKSIIEDPLSIIQSMGYKDKPSSLSYDTLKRMATRNSVISSIIQTRVNQVSTFSQPARYTRDGVGFEIKLRDPKSKPTKEQKRIMLALESFIENCGFSYDPSRDNFDTFLRKIVRDSLIYDQLTFEIVPDRVGRPAEMYAVDASTIRAAAIEPLDGEDYVHPTTPNASNIKWVQVIDNSVVAEFEGDELAFAVRNPRTDINIQPYGLSELEILVHQVTAHLWAEEYNSRYFSQGGTTKGILNIKGQNISKEQLDAFRRQWTAQIAGITGAWKTPVVSVEGLEYINVSQSNREMEYEMWMNYLINIACAVYQIDPAEINFPNRGGAGGSAGSLGEGGIEDRLKNSRDKGLRPLLRFIESVINRYIIRRFSPEYTFNFVGLNGESEQERLDLSNKQIRTFKTINEVRVENDLDPIEDGDIILDPTFVNYKMQKGNQEQMMQMGGDGGQGDVQDPNQDPNAQEGDQQEELSPEEQQRQQEDEQISQSIDQKYGQ
jgi:hypothetical protein